MRATTARVSSMKKAVDHLRTADPILARALATVGPFRMTYMEPTFHSLARSIVFQQLSTKVARVIFDRVAVLAGDPLTPQAILALSEEELRGAGLSKQKAAYIRDLAAREADIGFPGLKKLDDAEVIVRLTQVKGIGEWTAHMFLMFGLRRRNILPVGDLGIRMAIQKLYELPELPKPKEVERIAEPWHPYCSIAAWYLWRSLDGDAGMK